MVKEVFRVLPDERYDFLRIAEPDYEDWASKVLFETAFRGTPLKSLWNGSWNFVAMEEDLEEHPEGVGDFAHTNSLLVATNERSFGLLSTLLGDAAEILMGSCRGRDVWFFNVLRRVDRKGVGNLEEHAVFRVNPLGVDVLCGSGFKEGIERSKLSGLKFRKVDSDDEFGMV